jgi:hypothetical protein
MKQKRPVAAAHRLGMACTTFFFMVDQLDIRMTILSPCRFRGIVNLWPSTNLKP